MRIAVLGGIYSNYLALQAALGDIGRRGVDAIYCLGDLGAFGPHPDRVYPLLHEYDVHCIQGNYDNSLARDLSDCQCGYTDPRDNHFARISYQYTYSKTSSENRRWLGTLPSEIRLELGSRRALLCHGSPRQQNEFLWESTSSTAFLRHLFEQYKTDVILATHTGIKWHRRIDEQRHFINVGVLGRPENDGSNEVYYSLLEILPSGLDATFIPVQYDHHRLAWEMRSERLPEEFIETILTGWWTTCLEILPSKERRRGRW
jgi:predicted phosphodiesterase